MMAIWKIAPALAAGNTPRDQAVATPRRPRRCCSARSASEFFPPGVSTSSPATATPAGPWSSTRSRRWCRSPARCGPAWRSPRRPPTDLKRVHLELGGKAPVVVFDDADIEAAAEAIAGAGYFNAGQDCTAATRVLAGPGVHERLRRRAHRAGQEHQDRHARRRGRALRPGQQRQPARAASAASSTGCPTTPPSTPAASGSATRATSTRRPSSPGLKQDDEAIQDEIFGPVITVQQFTDEDEAAALGQRRPVRPGQQRLHQGPRPRDADGRAGSTSAACGSTPTSRSWPRCRTAGSSTRATARTSRCTASRTTPASSTSCTYLGRADRLDEDPAGRRGRRRRRRLLRSRRGATSSSRS